MDDATTGELRDGGSYRATSYSVELRNANGSIRETIDANDIRTVRRNQNDVVIQLKRGQPITVQAASLDDAGRLTSRLQSSGTGQETRQRGGTAGKVAKYGCLMPLIVVGALVVILIAIIAIAIGGSDDIGGDDVRVALRPGAEGTVTSAGETHKVTIESITDDARSTNQFSQPPQGMRYWVANVVVENADDDEIYAGDFKLRTSDNSEFSRKFTAGLDSIGQDYAIVQNLTPGGRTAGIVVFEIPQDVSITFLRYEGNPFAAGDLYFDAE
jgi:hypothetical protein